MEHIGILKELQQQQQLCTTATTTTLFFTNINILLLCTEYLSSYLNYAQGKDVLHLSEKAFKICKGVSSYCIPYSNIQYSILAKSKISNQMDIPTVTISATIMDSTLSLSSPSGLIDIYWWSCGTQNVSHGFVSTCKQVHITLGIRTPNADNLGYITPNNK